jgi:diguanylate cyclase (GGDEF)-like protein
VRAERNNRPLSLLLVDSDNLKLVNDTYGHQAGDQMLTTLAELLRGDTRLTDVVVRYGGDEFIVLLPETDLVGARFLAERLRATIEASPFTWQQYRIPRTITIGVATLPHDAGDGVSLIARAYAALYAGKGSGRNRVMTASEIDAPARAATAPSPLASPRTSRGPLVAVR